MGVDAEQTASLGLSTPASGQKRKRTDEPSTGSRSAVAVDQSSMIPRGIAGDSPLTGPEKTNKKKKAKVGETPPEKRLRRFALLNPHPLNSGPVFLALLQKYVLTIAPSFTAADSVPRLP